MRKYFSLFLHALSHKLNHADTHEHTDHEAGHTHNHNHTDTHQNSHTGEHVGAVCGGNHHNHADTHQNNQPLSAKKVLIIALLLNVVMFGVQLVFGALSQSITVLADAGDFLSDSFNYLVSLLILGSGVLIIKKANLLKIFSMLIISLGVCAYSIYKFLYSPTVPDYHYMYGVGILALSVNAYCVYLLSGHKNDNANMYSAWACSMNDMLGNIFIILVALLTNGLHSYWPDFIVGTVLAALAIYTSIRIWRRTAIDTQAT